MASFSSICSLQSILLACSKVNVTRQYEQAKLLSFSTVDPSVDHRLQSRRPNFMRFSTLVRQATCPPCMNASSFTMACAVYYRVVMIPFRQYSQANTWPNAVETRSCGPSYFMSYPGTSRSAQVSSYQCFLRDDYSSIHLSPFRLFPYPFFESSPPLAAKLFPGNACRLVAVPGQRPAILPSSSVGQMAGLVWFSTSTSREFG
jgi:hypothetical protein